MKIREAIYHSCPTCTSSWLISDESYGCDVCKKPIDRGGTQRQYLQATVFKHGKDAKNLEFCSWKCALKGLSKIETNYFVSLPYLHYDDHQKGIRAKDFFAAVKAFRCD